MKGRELIPIVLEEDWRNDDCWNTDSVKTLKKR
jgi:hypothetical protein